MARQQSFLPCPSAPNESMGFMLVALVGDRLELGGALGRFLRRGDSWTIVFWRRAGRGLSCSPSCLARRWRAAR